MNIRRNARFEGRQFGRLGGVGAELGGALPLEQAADEDALRP